MNDNDSHVDPYDMIRYAHGALDEAAAAAVREHRAGCSHCDEQIRATEALVAARKSGLVRQPSPRHRVTAVDAFVAAVVVGLVSATAWLLWYIWTNGTN